MSEAAVPGASQSVRAPARHRFGVRRLARCLAAALLVCSARPCAADAGIVVIVNGRNPVAALRPEQVTDIYAQRVRRWAALGGRDKPIVRLVKRGVHPAASEFARSLGSAAGDGRSDAHLVDGDLAAILFVAVDPYAIAYVSAVEAERLIGEGVRIKIVLRSDAHP